jgi:hypothetical protein
VGTAVIAHELGLLEGMRKRPRGSVVTVHMSRSGRRVATGRSNHSATPDRTKKRIFTNRMTRTETSMFGDAKTFMTA